ncbi:MAG: hypothetical protein GQ540_11095, partial [Lutibacter sp.]|nr:hypothetical protein [Lutibacter sp.]
FSRWNENYFSMLKTEDGWELTLQLRPGEYEYKFIVDGEWITDTENPLMNNNEFDGFNSVIRIGKLVTLKLNNNLSATKVILTGSFNNWNENNCKMIKTKNGWEYTFKLPSGKHHYKFIVDNNWIVDPDNPVQEYDYDGNINSVYIVK